jgi:flagellin-like hook-associated protein FlgL
LSIAAANSHRYSGILTLKSDINESGNADINDLAALIPLLDPTLVTDSSVPGNRTELQDATKISFKDSLGRAGTAYLTVARNLGNEFGTFTKYGTNPISIPDNATVLTVLGVATSQTGESASSINSTLTSNGQIPGSLSINLSFTSSGATAAINLDLSGLQVESYDTGRSSERPTAIGFTNIENRSSARRGLNVVKNRIDSLSQIQGQYGALVSRLSVAHNILGASRENFAAASSRIKDADIAAESSVAIRSGILQQTASSVLAQANQAPQVALSLLRNI